MTPLSGAQQSRRRGEVWLVGAPSGLSAPERPQHDSALPDSIRQSNNGTQQGEKLRRCPAGWTHHQKYCYYLNTHKKSTWEEAEQDCVQMPGSHLTSVQSQSAMRWLWKFASKKPFWIGLKSSERLSPWSWENGQHWTFSNFKPSSSFLSGASEESCTLVRRRKEWTEKSCNERHRYICSVPI